MSKGGRVHATALSSAGRSMRAMDTALAPVSDALVAIHARFAVEKVWCQNPARRLRRFIEAVESARSRVPTPMHAYFDRRIDAIRAELFCDCDDALRTFSLTQATVRRAA